MAVCRACGIQIDQGRWYCGECRDASDKYSDILNRDRNRRIKSWARLSFIKWFTNQNRTQNNCFYCGISKEEAAEYYDVTGRVNGDNPTRGKKFEVDRKENSRGYAAENCTLSCYYCNNAKSDAFKPGEFKDTIGPAIAKVIRSNLGNATVS